MINRPEFGRTAERHDEVPCDHVGFRPIRPAVRVGSGKEILARLTDRPVIPLPRI